MDSAQLHTVIISPEIVGPVKNGGIGTFATNFAFLLALNGYRVTIIFGNSYMDSPREVWQPVYDMYGIEVIHAFERHDPVHAFGNYWFRQRSDAVADAIPDDADIVYFQDWHANAFEAIRRRRYKDRKYPVFVNVIHSSTAWIREAMEVMPENIDDLYLEYAERYSARESDFLISPSEYLIQWAREDGWQLPPDERVMALGYPFLPDENRRYAEQVNYASRYRRIISFGRTEVRKGFELLIDTLVSMKESSQRQVLDDLEEVVFLGRNGHHRWGDAQSAGKYLQGKIGIPVRVIDTYDTYQAGKYIADHRADSLVIMPSLVDNYPFAVIEASLIPGVNLICADTGGIPEILGREHSDQFFLPYKKKLSVKLGEWLKRGPVSAEHLGHYDHEQHNQDWLNLHTRVCKFAISVQNEPIPEFTFTKTDETLVDVCIPYHNHPEYLPQLLTGLSQQTVQNFTVYVVNDASTTDEANQVFEEMRAKYESLGWHFLENEENQGLSETRNIAAWAGESEFIVFMDADNVPAPNMIERFLDSIERSGDDCLTCYMRAFRGEHFPYEVVRDASTFELLEIRECIDIEYNYLPLGDAREMGIFNNVFGDANFIVRREVFETLKGFEILKPHYHFITGEDHEFLARLVFNGYKMDVIPEYLFYYRHLDDSIFRTTRQYQNISRILEAYREQLREVGLERLIPLLHGMNNRLKFLEHQYSQYQNQK